MTDGIEVMITGSGLVVSCTGSVKGNGRALTNEQLAELRASAWKEALEDLTALNEKIQGTDAYELKQLIRALAKEG